MKYKTFILLKNIIIKYYLMSLIVEIFKILIFNINSFNINKNDKFKINFFNTKNKKLNKYFNIL